MITHVTIMQDFHSLHKESRRISDALIMSPKDLILLDRQKSVLQQLEEVHRVIKNKIDEFFN